MADPAADGTGGGGPSLFPAEGSAPSAASGPSLVPPGGAAPPAAGDAAPLGPDAASTAAGTAAAPIDPAGAASALAEDAGPLDALAAVWAAAGAGGPVLALLAGLSLVALATVLAKLLQFARAGLGPAEAEAALAGAEALRRGTGPAPPSRHPAALLTALAAAARAESVDPVTLREEMERVGRARLAALRSHFRLLEAIGALAPLLGLFGTVLGMIEAFRALEGAGGAVDPALLSGGIWQALLTTAAGLAVAMPAVAALAWLERRVERTAETLEDALARLTSPPPPGSGIGVERPSAPGPAQRRREAGG